MNAHECNGQVSALRGQKVLFTGKITVDGSHIDRPRCGVQVRNRGGEVAPDQSRSVTLLVHGDLGSRGLTDPKRGYSRKLVFVERVMAQEHQHVHVIDSAGFGALLHGLPAPCHRLRERDGVVHAETITGDPHFGEVLTRHRETVHDTSGLRVDLSALDAGTAAHERTLGALKDHLNDRGIQAFGPTSSAPRFDAGWDDANGRVIAEVKSLSGASQAQQIRLGLGQVLEYTYVVSQDRPARAVLVLEREPQSLHWGAVARSAGVRLTWAPDFEGL